MDLAVFAVVAMLVVIVGFFLVMTILLQTEPMSYTVIGVGDYREKGGTTVSAVPIGLPLGSGLYLRSRDEDEDPHYNVLVTATFSWFTLTFRLVMEDEAIAKIKIGETYDTLEYVDKDFY